MNPPRDRVWKAGVWRWLALIFLFYSLPAFAGPVTASDLGAHIAYLADDELQGRFPGSEGDRLATRYIALQFEAAGLIPAGQEGWFSPVSIIVRRPVSAQFNALRNHRLVSTPVPEMVAMGDNSDEDLGVLPLYIAGAGGEMDTPLPDLKGHVVLLIDRPMSHEPGMEEINQARAVHDRFVAAGAAALFVVTQRAPRLQDIFAGLGTSATELSDGRPMAKVEGAISTASVVAMVAAGGQDWDQLLRRLAEPGVVGLSLPVEAHIAVETVIERLESRNVIGRIKGRRGNQQAVLAVAHWDHLGLCGKKDATDRICNGATDNASGVATLIALARKLKGANPDRDIYLIASTAEELGLLGMESFVRTPPVALKDIVAAFNLDTLGIAPAGSSVAIIGRGRTALDPWVERVIHKQNLQIDTHEYAQQFMDRQDGWMLTLAGVPALMINSGFSDPDRADAFLADPYHRPDDEYHADMDLSGVVQDANLHVELLRFFASYKKYPANRAGERRAD